MIFMKVLLKYKYEITNSKLRIDEEYFSSLDV